MSWILEYSPIFFDFDGLLVNTEHLHFQAYQKMLEINGISFPWDFSTFCSIAHKSSEGLREAITSRAPDIVSKKTWEALYEEKTHQYINLLEEGKLELMPGAQTILEIVRIGRIPHAVVTNSTRTQTDLIRKKIPILNDIPHWITREDYQNPKPSPDAYLKAIEVLGKSDKMLGFEDSIRGVWALESASITPILICSPDHPQMEEIPEDSFDCYSSFTDLFSLS